MKYCTECNSEEPSRVVDSRPSTLPKSGKPSVRRERKCQCGNAWFTYEITETDLSRLLNRPAPSAFVSPSRRPVQGERRA